jgi:membrane-bound ClpP family serine protease
MSKRININPLLAIIISLINKAIIIFVLFFVLSFFGIDMPIWLIITLVIIFSAITFIVYRAQKKSPLLGFENMIGKSGITVNQIARGGTIKIGRELWHAETDGENIEVGEEVTVIRQAGLKLTVIRRNKDELTN